MKFARVWAVIGTETTATHCHRISRPICRPCICSRSRGNANLHWPHRFVIATTPASLTAPIPPERLLPASALDPAQLDRNLQTATVSCDRNILRATAFGAKAIQGQFERFSALAGAAIGIACRARALAGHPLLPRQGCIEFGDLAGRAAMLDLADATPSGADLASQPSASELGCALSPRPQADARSASRAQS
jgi:hypothetical protein